MRQNTKTIGQKLSCNSIPGPEGDCETHIQFDTPRKMTDSIYHVSIHSSRSQLICACQKICQRAQGDNKVLISSVFTPK